MENYVLEAIERYSLLENANRKVTVAISGGADSMALLHVLLKLKDKLNIDLSAAHLNHMIRGAEADRDQEFVKKQCEALGVALFNERANIPKYAEENGISTELAARKVRYDFLERVSEGVVATAHTASDNLETVLFNLSRGTAVNGLCGIPAKRGKIIRPLLLCTRSQIEEYCEKNGIPFVTDSTNLTDDYTRNKIRHNAVTVLKEINPSVEYAVLRMCASLKEDTEFLDSLAEEYIAKNTDADGSLLLKNFGSLHCSVAKRVIRKFIEDKNPEISLENIHIESAFTVAMNGGRTSLPKNCSAVSSKNKLTVEKNGLNAQNNTEFSVEITECDNTFFESIKKVNNLLLNNSIDCDKIKGKLVVRTRNAGDSIRLKNRGCTKTLNRLYSEKRVPVGLRDSIPVIADDLGVIWVYGIGVAQRAAVTNSTKQAALIEVKFKGEIVKW